VKEQSKSKLSLRKRFIFTLVMYAAIIFVLWFGYHTITYQALNDRARESTILAAENLIREISAEFAQMQTVASAIAGSSYVQDFLKEQNISAAYDRAEAVSEIIRKAAFPISSSDSLITISADGNFYRFSGGLSNGSCVELHKTFQGAGSVFTIAELDGTLFFCHNAPVFETAGQFPNRIGNVVMLTALDKKRRALDSGNGFSDIDTALIMDSAVIISNNPALEGMDAAGLEAMYGILSSAPVAGTPLTVAAAIPKDAMFPENSAFIIIATALLLLLMSMIVFLYRYLSNHMIRPMADVITHVREIGGSTERRLPTTGKKDFDALVSDINDMLDRNEAYNTELAAERQKRFDMEMLKQKMRIGLLASQMDAHFVVNTLEGLQMLSDKGENSKASRMAAGLTVLLKHQHTGDAMVNVFDDFQILEKYIEIMNIKYDKEFAVTYDVEDRLEACLMPGLILQPIVENALTHGFMNKKPDAKLTLSGNMPDNAIRFEISDNGAGIPPAKLKTIQEDLEKAEFDEFPEPGLRGVALPNIQRRIRLRFGSGYGLQISSVWGEGTTVTVSLPAIPDN
jgi:sensor histidine kinase YesM